MTFAFNVGNSVFAHVSVDAIQDESADMEVGVRAPVVVDAVNFVVVYVAFAGGSRRRLVPLAGQDECWGRLSLT